MKFFLALTLLSAGATAQTAPPAMPSAAALAARVDTHYNHLNSLQAHYAERYQGMGRDRTETGTLTLRKPGRMRWAYDSPAGKVFVIDGKFAIWYSPGDASASRLPVKQLDDLHSPLRFLLGHTQLAKELDHLSLAPANSDSGAQLYTLTGTPKGMEQRLRSLSLVVDPGGIIHSMRAEEQDGAVTTFTFSSIHENVPISPADFNFTPPPGVTIIDGTTPL